MHMANVRPLPELAEYRERQTPPLSRTALARQLGVSRPTIWRWERGVRRPDRKHAPKLAELTGVPVLEIVGVE